MLPLISMFAAATREELIARNPALGLDLPALDTRIPQPWSSLQMQRFLAGVAGTELFPLWMMLANTGCRIGEATALRVADLDLEPANLTIWIRRTDRRIGGDAGTKTSRSGRTVSIEPALARVLHEVIAGRDGEDHVFRRRDGSPWRASQVRYWLGREAERLGLPPLTLHEFRHTAATQMVANQVPDAVIKAMLGHKSIVTTIDTYTHVNSAMQRVGSSTLARLYGMDTPADTTTSPPDAAEN
jgi:integrase